MNAEQMREQGCDEACIDAMYEQMQAYLETNYEQALATWKLSEEMLDAPSLKH